MAVNLLPWREARHQQRIRQFYGLFILGLIVILTSWLILSAKSVMFLLQQKREINQLQQHMQEISSEYSHSLAIQKKFQQQTQAENYINAKLQDNQILLKLLNEIGQKMPQNLYLTQIQKNSKTLSFRGNSTSHTEITLLLKNLENQPDSGHPRLTETKHTDLHNSEIEFELTYENPSAKQYEHN